MLWCCSVGSLDRKCLALLKQLRLVLDLVPCQWVSGVHTHIYIYVSLLPVTYIRTYSPCIWSYICCVEVCVCVCVCMFQYLCVGDNSKIAGIKKMDAAKVKGLRKTMFRNFN